MTKKNQNENETTDTDENEAVDGLGGLDFNVTDEYKTDPLVPNGTYHGNVTKVSFNASQASINWSICLNDNGGLLSDGETPLDGSYVFYTNWLPRPGDENLMTASGKNTKRQSKINMLAEFAEALGIDMSTPQAILAGIENGEWIGMAVDVTTQIEEYNGKFSSKVKLGGMKKSSLYEE